ncbi:GL21236 [Drosophila persimilis]|uniref:GL21236 n=1 Tax=Drosophila persimilis TaxID=7234 RepID=B4HAS2_DROPE|nr:GL21236 [Drosophila persimilis]
MSNATKMVYSYRILWLSGVLLAPILLAAIAVQGQEPASPVFQNHKTKEWTNLDNITFSFDCKRRSVGFLCRYGVQLPDLPYVRRRGQSDSTPVRQRDELQSGIQNLRLGLQFQLHRVTQGRTFGKIRRLQMALIPIIFKFGVLSAMVAFLVAIGMKSLFLLKVLVLMNAVAILGKFITLKSTLFGQYEHTAPTFNYPGWNPHAKESWGATGLSGPGGPNGHPPSKEIHLHIHGNAQTQAQLAGQGYNYETQGGWASRSDPYGGYAPTGQFGESQQPAVATADAVPKDTDPMALLPTKYRARHLIR